MSGRAGPAAKYTDKFIDAILEGIVLYKSWEQESRLYGVEGYEEEGVVDGGDMCEADPFSIPFEFSNTSWCSGANNGKTLDPTKVGEARRGEIEGFTQRKVYEARPRAEAIAEGIKPIGVRWVDVEKKTQELGADSCARISIRKRAGKKRRGSIRPHAPAIS